jgi:hypothetical protein
MLIKYSLKGKKLVLQLDMVVYTYKPSSQVGEERGSRFQNQPRLYTENLSQNRTEQQQKNLVFQKSFINVY